MVLITGASTGIGRGAAFWMAARGWRSLAGVRTDADAASITADAQRDGLAVEPVTIDVADAGSIGACVQEVRRRLGAAPLTGLVNNAGIAVAGPVEYVPLEAWRRQFEVNLFGQVAVTQAFLPMLREAMALLGRRRARVVLMSSIAGRVGQPILGPYSASKHALEAVGDALRLELWGQGIQVSIIEPGAVDTPIWRKGKEQAADISPDDPRLVLYRRAIEGVHRAFDQIGSRAVSVDATSRAVERCLTARRPPTRIVVGKDARRSALARRLLPMRWFDRMVARRLNIPLD